MLSWLKIGHFRRYNVRCWKAIHLARSQGWDFVIATTWWTFVKIFRSSVAQSGVASPQVVNQPGQATNFSEDVEKWRDKPESKHHQTITCLCVPLYFYVSICILSKYCILVWVCICIWHGLNPLIPTYCNASNGPRPRLKRW